MPCPKSESETRVAENSFGTSGESANDASGEPAVQQLLLVSGSVQERHAHAESRADENDSRVGLKSFATVGEPELERRSRE